MNWQRNWRENRKVMRACSPALLGGTYTYSGLHCAAVKPACCCTERIILISILCLSIEVFHFIELVMVFHQPLCVKPKIVIYQFEKNCPYPDFIPQTIPLLPVSPIKQSWPSCLFIYSAHRVRAVHVLQKMCWLLQGAAGREGTTHRETRTKLSPILL